MLNEPIFRNPTPLKQVNPLMKNNCQNNLEVSTHDIALATMPFGSMLIATPTTPITLRYEYNWEEPGVLAI